MQQDQTEHYERAAWSGWLTPDGERSRRTDRLEAIRFSRQAFGCVG